MSAFRYALFCAQFAAASFLLQACNTHQVADDYTPRLAGDEQLVFVAASDAPDLPLVDWYQVFESAALNDLVVQALQDNMDIWQAWLRLDQAALNAGIAEGAAYPELAINGGGRVSENRLPEMPQQRVESLFVGLNLGWEIDLWGRIRDARRAADAEFSATASDLDYTALLLSGQITRGYFRLLEQNHLLLLLEEQRQLHRQLLQVLRLRQGAGQASLLDVLRQQQQILASDAGYLVVEQRAADLRADLAVFLGHPPHALASLSLAGDLPLLPALPAMASGAELLQRHPALRAAYHRLRSLDHRIAEEVASRLPRLALALDYQHSSSGWNSSLDTENRSALLNLQTLLFDAGRGRRRVMAAKKRLALEYARFSQLFLQSVREIEGAVLEARALERRHRLTKERLDLAHQAFAESQQQYANGLIDYLVVLNALATVQGLEQQHLQQRRALLEARVRLYMAWGGRVRYQRPVSLPSVDDGDNS